MLTQEVQSLQNLLCSILTIFFTRILYKGLKDSRLRKEIAAITVLDATKPEIIDMTHCMSLSPPPFGEASLFETLWPNLVRIAEHAYSKEKTFDKVRM